MTMETQESAMNEEEKKVEVNEEEQTEVEAQGEVKDEVEAEVEDSMEHPQDHQEDDFKEKFYYLAAEMENLRKRHEKEKESLLKYGNEKVLSGLLEVVDNLERTLQAIENDNDDKVKNIFTGIDMVRNQFLDTLKANGLELVEAVGKQFDPNFHEAMAQQPAEGKEDNEVLLEYQKGYILNGRLLRPAKVVIVKN